VPPSKVRQLYFVLIGLALVSCQAATPSAPVPTPQYWRVQYTPALAWMAPAFNLCIRQQPGFALAVFERPASTLDITQADITLRWGAAADSSGAQVELGSDDLVLVVNPQNPLQSLTGSQVRNIFSGTSRAWSDFSKGNVNSIVVWSYPQGSEMRQFFEDALSPVDLLSSAHLAPDPNALRQSVAADPSAIGYLPGRWVDSSVRPLLITGSPAPSLRQPILAATHTAVKGAQKEWLLCLQRSIAQK
jgi:ABC-type phosphate transport system substrate-binding protein